MKLLEGCFSLIAGLFWVFMTIVNFVFIVMLYCVPIAVLVVLFLWFKSLTGG